jgi:hypothetical protein
MSRFSTFIVLIVFIFNTPLFSNKPINKEVNPLYKGVFDKKNAFSINNDSIEYQKLQWFNWPFFNANARYDVAINPLVGYANGTNVIAMAGIGNISKGNTKGVQAAGVFNHVGGTLNGVQWAGVLNTAAKTKAINQSAGCVNVAIKGTIKSQFAGVANLGDTLQGVQASGVFNHARYVQGLQAAGVFNEAKEIKGVQAAGVFNVAKKVKGVQVGLINYADTLNGMQIGLLNFSRFGGYKVLELSSNEINPINIAFKSGSRKFYTIFQAGVGVGSKSNVWNYGFGLGTHKNLNRISDLNVEANMRHLNVRAFAYNPQEWLQLGLFWNIHLGKRFEFVAGPTYNALFSDKNDDKSDEVFPSFIKPVKANSRDFGINRWIGGNVSLRLVL